MRLISNGFLTEMPDEWNDGTMVTLTEPLNGQQFATNIVVTRQIIAPGQSIEDYTAAQIGFLREAVENFQALDFRATAINSYPACQSLHRFVMNNFAVQQVQTFILANQTVFNVCGTALVAEFAKHLPAFRQVVENFRVYDADELVI